MFRSCQLPGMSLWGVCVFLQLEGRWADLGPLASQLGVISPQYLPEATLAEMEIAQREFENTRIVTVCGDSIEQGFVTGSPGHLKLDTIKTAPIVQAIQLASMLQCRTEQASWVSRLAEAVLELRTCVREGDFKNMQRVVLAVRALDKVPIEVRAGQSGFRAGCERPGLGFA